MNDNFMGQALSVTGCAASAATADALKGMSILHLVSRHATDASRVEVRLLSLNTAQATQLLVTRLLPLGNQHSVCIAVLQQPVVELL